MYRILIIEDDPVIAESLVKTLRQWNYEAESVKDFMNVMDEINTYQPHLILLDISLPFFDGYHWSQTIRKVSNVPIMFVSSMADNMNIVMAMRMGGDDFIAKPFDLNVIVAKIEALLRRSYKLNGSMEIIEHKGLMLNISDATAEYQGNKVELSKNEFKILQVLMENVGKVIERDAIMMKLWESDSFIDDNTLTVNVTRLRKRLSEIGVSDYVITKKGMGYMVEQ